jgi:hypothetical protein
MRLINTRTLRLEEFYDPIPKYATLSHTWGDEEVTFQDWQYDLGSAKHKAGFAKIRGSCEEALRHGLNYLWCDTNCIDKTSSAELTEAINSMFDWYKNSVVCFAYLADVPPLPDHGPERLACFRKSRWFTRGWTLQELLAPAHLVFFANDWTKINDRSALAQEIASLTGIGERYLGLHEQGGRSPEILSIASVAERMSWLSLRETTRIEDLAYCMLGIFDINMPLLYGEGRKAFLRLQEEIIRVSNDQTIFCWMWDDRYVPQNWVSILSPSPRTFEKSGTYSKKYSLRSTTVSYTVTNAGLLITLPVLSCKPCVFAILDVQYAEGTPRVAIPLSEIPGTDIYKRCSFPPCPVPAVYRTKTGLERSMHISVREGKLWQDKGPTAEELDFDFGAVVTATSNKSLKIAPLDSSEFIAPRLRGLPPVLKLKSLGAGDKFGGVLGIFVNPAEGVSSDISGHEVILALVYLGVYQDSSAQNSLGVISCCKVLGLEKLKYRGHRRGREFDDSLEPLNPGLVHIFHERVTSAAPTVREWMDQSISELRRTGYRLGTASLDNWLKTPTWDLHLKVSVGNIVLVNTRSSVFMVQVYVEVTERKGES